MTALLRLVVSLSGVLKANFADGTILVLSSSGSSFAIWPQGEARYQKQLSEFALHRHTAFLLSALEFRNMHMDRPFVCKLTEQEAM